MDGAVAVAIIGACATVVTVVPAVAFREGSSLSRRNIEKDIELAQQLELGSKTRIALEESIAERIKVLSGRSRRAAINSVFNRAAAITWVVVVAVFSFSMWQHYSTTDAPTIAALNLGSTAIAGISALVVLSALFSIVDALLRFLDHVATKAIARWKDRRKQAD